ncbi:MAG: PQQ-binding-like beta-propeller repeat protein [Gammaproteobacteria bacterium]|nr:PQQ-binding-like beta-propeller repeat protein [Gammaproteobacteria bacterium]MDP2141989.1 PQQ-binding-like beta-propeller repeat protein [Gammaproteobacteria bacterium]MDP2348432.1 PQQ-binding-like beta-propeller repeat protein [Gammaproteobacteria bacterium]
MHNDGMMLAGKLLLAAAVFAAGCSPQDTSTQTSAPGAVATAPAATTDSALPGIDWPVYRGDIAGTGHSSLTQINADNVASLTTTWRYSLRAAGDSSPAGPNSQATPIVVNGVMYLPTADAVVALNPITGEEIWHHTVQGETPSRRGVAYWPGEDNMPPRILFTAGQHLIALNAFTGEPVTLFGDGGAIDLGIPYNSVPLVYEDIVIVGANTPRGAIGGIGNARAYDLRNGLKLWEFSSVPQPGELGHDTWEGDSWVDRVGVNAWPFYFTMDAERELLYLPLASPIPFAYGGDREGSNLFGNSVVAVNINSGEYVWHFQTIHHDIWDHDPPAAPALFDITRNGTTIPALGVTTKSGYLYILNRATGEPVYGVEETPVPQSNVPGEHTFATQPIPVNPPALARVSYEPADLVRAEQTSAEHAQACAELVANSGEIINEGPFTPWTYRAAESDTNTTLLFPGLVGGPNWGGAAFDPASGYIFVFSQDVGTFGWMQAAADALLPYERSGPRPANFDVQIGDSRWPCQSPPWGRLTAVDSNSGDIVWQKPVGITEGLPPETQQTGRPGRAAAIATASNLLFMASTDDNRFRALDAATGDELWVTTLPQRGNANPMTYSDANGKQYVVIVATDEVVAFTLP